MSAATQDSTRLAETPLKMPAGSKIARSATCAAGVAGRMVTDLIETRSGEYWIATFNGIARFNPNGAPPDPVNKKAGKRRAEPRFVPYPADWRPKAERVSVLLEDGDGTIWCGTEAGLCHLQKAGSQ